MDEWLDIIAGKLKEERLSLPPDDWCELEEKYQSRKKSKRYYPLAISFVTAAAAAVVALVVLNDPPEIQIIEKHDALSAVSEIPASKEAVGIFEDFVEESIPELTGQRGNVQESVPEEVEESQLSVVKEVDHKDPGGDSHPEAAGENNDHKDLISLFEPARHTPQKRIALASHLGGLNSSNDALEESHPGPGSTTFAERANHSVPISFGLDISYLLNDRLALTSGVEMSLYKSTFSYVNDKGEYNTANQKAWYLGIPLKIDYTFWQSGRFSAWMGAGGKVDRCVFAVRNGEKVSDDSFNWSVLSNAGIRYGLFDHVGVFIAPEVTWYIESKAPKLSTYRTDNPLIFSLNAGIRFCF